MEFIAARRKLRDEIINNAALRNALEQFRDAPFFPSAGNGGDALIQVGTFDLFREIGMAPRRIKGLAPGSLDGVNALIFGGGGGWVERLYKFYPKVLTPFLERGGRLLVLPSSFDGYQDYFRQFANQVTIFAREKASLDLMRATPGLEASTHLCHDMAFATDVDRFSDLQDTPGAGRLQIFRRDDESTRPLSVPPESLDLPLAFNGTQWASPEQSIAPIAAMAQLISLFEEVETDRLHMAVLSALIGRRVLMAPNGYHKNAGVFEYSLSTFDNVQFAPPQNNDAMMRGAAAAQIAALVRKTEFLSRELQNARGRNLYLSSLLDNRKAERTESRSTALAKEQKKSAQLSEKVKAQKAEIQRLYGLPVLGLGLRAVRKFRSMS